MNKRNILLIHCKNKETLGDIGNCLVNEVVNSGDLFIDYRELYIEKGQKGLETYIEDIIQKNNIAIVIFWTEATGFHFDVNFIEKLRKKVFTAMILIDTEYYYEVRDRYYAQAMDLVVVYSKPNINYYGTIGINAVGFSGFYDGKHYVKLKDTIKDVDVSFIGLHSCHSKRLEYINYLKNNNVPVLNYGINSENGALSPDKMVDLINRTKINLNFTDALDSTRLSRNLKIHKLLTPPKGRLPQVALCGGFILSQYAYGIEDIFTIGKEVDVFYDKPELLEKIKYYLKHDDVREQIALNGYKRAVESYDGNKSVPKLLDSMVELANKKKYRNREIYLDDIFIRNYSTFRILLIIRFIRALKLNLVFEEFLLVCKHRNLDIYQVFVFIKEEVIDKLPLVKKALKKLKLHL